MKTGLILEGGAMRGMFTAGVLDVLMEQGITVDGMVGVSAGAVFGCNYKSHQIGRTIRYNTTYCNDKRYASFRNLLRTGNLYSEDFCYHEVPEKLDPFDDKAFRESPMDYFVVCTDVRTGDPIYHKCRTGDAEDVRWMEASASMPLAAKIVKIGHYGLLDGGVADSIPIRFFESIGYKRNLIILTQPKGFVKKKNPMLPAIRARYLRYPAFVEAVADRHERYNETLSYISMLEQSGKDYVIRPPIPLEIGAMERDPDQLRRVYETGRAVAQIQIDKIASRGMITVLYWGKSKQEALIYEHSGCHSHPAQLPGIHRQAHQKRNTAPAAGSGHERPQLRQCTGLVFRGGDRPGKAGTDVRCQRPPCRAAAESCRRYPRLRRP